MGVATRDQLLAARLRTVEVAAPELGEGVVVRLRELTNSQVEQWRTSGNLEERADVRLLLRCLVDAQDQPLFGAEDEDAIAALPFQLVNRLAAAALELNALTATDEVLEKN